MTITHSTSSAQSVIRLHPADPIVVAVRELVPGEVLMIDGHDVLTVREVIPSGHKVALSDVPAGAVITRYGSRIGIATTDIPMGTWVHSHNLDVGPIPRDYSYTVVPALCPQPSGRTFMGYARRDGRVGTRNYVAVISSVHCSGHVTLQIARQFTPERLAAYPNVDGVIPIVHHSGCSLPPSGPAQRYLKRLLSNIARHPNIGAALFVGLGCETTQAEECAAMALAQDPVNVDVPWITIQDKGGFRRTVEAGVAELERLLTVANTCTRTPQPLAALQLGLECGGSDTLSGVTANPLVGLAADRIVMEGGTAVLAETTEVFGAEDLLLSRVTDAAVAERLIERFRWWLDHADKLDFTVDNNPTPGNKRGGLTTIFEKSLGAVAKGGSTPLCAVYEYAERVDRHGFVFMDTPGSDPASVTGLVAGGCNMVIFTTGRGTVYSSNVAPCIKVGSNSQLYARLSDDIDCNAGKVLDGVSWDDAANELTELIIAAASGQPTKSEYNGLPDNEFIPWQPDGLL